MRKSIDEVKAKFERFPNIFLTEEDIRSHLFAVLLKNGFSTIRTTEDDSSSIELHSEVRWYGRQAKKMKYRSDIVLIDVSQLKTRGAAGYELPSKGYGFNGFFRDYRNKAQKEQRRIRQ